MSTPNSFVPDIHKIEDAGKFLLQRGFKVQFGDEYSVDFVSNDYSIEISTEPFYGGVTFRIRPKCKRIGVGIFMCAQYDPDIEYSKYFSDDMSRIEFIRGGMALLEKFPEKFFNKEYLQDMDERFNPLIEGGFCNIASHKNEMETAKKNDDKN